MEPREILGKIVEPGSYSEGGDSPYAIQRFNKVWDAYLAGINVPVHEIENVIVVGYLTGNGTTYNPRSGFMMLRECARKGSVLSQMRLAQAYLSGDFVNRNAAEAKKWLKMAAKQKHPEALRLLENWSVTSSQSETKVEERIK